MLFQKPRGAQKKEERGGAGSETKFRNGMNAQQGKQGKQGTPVKSSNGVTEGAAKNTTPKQDGAVLSLGYKGVSPDGKEEDGELVISEAEVKRLMREGAEEVRERRGRESVCVCGVRERERESTRARASRLCV